VIGIVIILSICAAAGWIVAAMQAKRIKTFVGLAATMITDLEKVRADRDRFRKFSEDVILERNRAMALYRKFGLQTSVAQQWLLRDLQRALAVANAYRKDKGEKPLELNPKLKEIVEDYPDSIERSEPAAPVPELPPELKSELSIANDAELSGG
jgi:hypothetical protein